jgi:hypothetical protein
MGVEEGGVSVGLWCLISVISWAASFIGEGNPVTGI